MAVEKIEVGTGEEAAAEVEPLCTMAEDELLALNEACSLMKLAKSTLDRTWTAIRDKYNLPTGEIWYDRATGVVTEVPAGG